MLVQGRNMRFGDFHLSGFEFALLLSTVDNTFYLMKVLNEIYMLLIILMF